MYSVYHDSQQATIFINKNLFSKFSTLIRKSPGVGHGVAPEFGLSGRMKLTILDYGYLVRAIDTP